MTSTTPCSPRALWGLTPCKNHAASGGQSHGLSPPALPPPSKDRLISAAEGPRRGAAHAARRPSPAEAQAGLTAPERNRAALPVQAARGGPGPAPLGRAQAPPGARGGGLSARGRRLHALPGRCRLLAPLGSGPWLEARRAAGEDSGAPSAALLGGRTPRRAGSGRRERDVDSR